MDIERVQDGKIQLLVAEKGFGFIKPAASGPDVFFHYSIVDAPFETLAHGQQVKYDLDVTTDKPRARCVQTGGASGNNRSSRSHAHRSPNAPSRDTRRVTDSDTFERGFVTKLHRQKSRGFISSIEHGPEYLFAAESVTGAKPFSRLEVGDYVQFLVGEPDPADPKQLVAEAVKVIEREVKITSEKQLRRHPKARRKKPTWR